MNKKSVVFLFGILMCLTATSQSFIGYGYDNYSGVNGVLLNPGTLADSTAGTGSNGASVF